MLKFLLIAPLAFGLFAQDKITITVTRGTVTRTAEIPAAGAAEAMKALDYYVSQQGGRIANETVALHEMVAAILLGYLRSTPGTAVKAATDAEATARAAREKADAEFLKAAGAPVQ